MRTREAGGVGFLRRSRAPKGGPQTLTRQTTAFRNSFPSADLYNIQGGPPNSSGFDGGKKVKGRKRHLLVDTTGLVVKALVHPADVPDGTGGQRLLEAIADRAQALPRLRHLWVDTA